MKNLVVLTGAGMSAESGLKTFRDSGGLWENHNVYEVATPEAWRKNPELVLEFYNDRRNQALTAKPNKGHYVLAELEESFNVSIITQNVDDFHERAGSKNVLHLHGSLFESRSELNENLKYPITRDIKLGDLAEDGNQLRPNIVWFGEPVVAMDDAINITKTSDLLLIVGTSFSVYPAAGLINYVKPNTQIFIIDPVIPEVNDSLNVKYLQNGAVKGCILFKKLVLKN